jgi:hypothetical protein
MTLPYAPPSLAMLELSAYAKSRAAFSTNAHSKNFVVEAVQPLRGLYAMSMSVCSSPFEHLATGVAWSRCRNFSQKTEKTLDSWYRVPIILRSFAFF